MAKNRYLLAGDGRKPEEVADSLKSHILNALCDLNSLWTAYGPSDKDCETVYKALMSTCQALQSIGNR